MSAAPPPRSPAPPRLRLLQAAWATSSFDRFAAGPLLVSVAATYAVTLAQAAAAVSSYLLCYGLAQPLWGVCCDRLGRVATVRLALGLAAAAGTVAVAAPSLAVLVVARAVVGACIAAVIPAGLVYVGDVVAPALRQRTLSDFQSAQALGTTAAMACSGVLAAAASWRLALLLPVVAAAVLALALRRLPEPVRAAARAGGTRAVLRRRGARVVLLLALVEGAALLGFLTYLAPALEASGRSPGVAGAVVACYGAGLLLASQVVKRVVDRAGGTALIAGGSLLLVTAYLVAAAGQGVVGVGAAAVLVGAAWAPLHSTMQAWAVQVAPGARAAMVSAYVALLFVGSAVATSAVAPLAGAGSWTALFGTGALVALACGAGATTARALADRDRLR